MSETSVEEDILVRKYKIWLVRRTDTLHTVINKLTSMLRANEVRQRDKVIKTVRLLYESYNTYIGLYHYIDINKFTSDNLLFPSHFKKVIEAIVLPDNAL